MAKRMSNKKRQSRRRVLRGGDDAKPVEPAAAIKPAAAESGSFMGNLFSTESKQEAAAAVEEVAPAEATTEPSPDAVEEAAPAAAATAAVMASAYKTKQSKSKKPKSKKGKKCKTAKGNCKKWFKLNKNRLCASASPPM
jgi:hypothetical protein